MLISAGLLFFKLTTFQSLNSLGSPFREYNGALWPIGNLKIMFQKKIKQ